MNTPALLRNIPVFNSWLSSEGAYMANDTDDFVRLTEDILERRVPSLVENGYEIVRSRSFAQTGRQLAEAYERAIRVCKDRTNTK